MHDAVQDTAYRLSWGCSALVPDGDDPMVYTLCGAYAVEVMKKVPMCAVHLEAERLGDAADDAAQAAWEARMDALRATCAPAVDGAA